MPTFTQNLNEIIDTKKEIASIIKERGIDPGDTFSDYPTYLRSVMASGDIAGLDNYVSKLELSYQSYVQLPYFNSTLENYVQEGFLATNYIDYSYLYSYVGDVVNDLVLGTVDLEPYVTHTELQGMGYMSAADLVVEAGSGKSSFVLKDSNSKALAAYSVAQGLNNVVNSNHTNAHVEGTGNISSAIGSHSEGRYNWPWIQYMDQSAIGRENSYSYVTSRNNADEIITSIGVGSGPTTNGRKNAVTILESGKIYINGVGNYNGKEVIRENWLSTNQQGQGGYGFAETETFFAKSLQEVLAEVPSYEFTYSYIQSSIRGFLQSIDFSSYVTYAYLGSALSDLETDLMDDINNTPTFAYLYTYVGDALSDVDVDLSDYPTFDDISDMGYITMGDVSACGYITAADVPEVDLDDYPTYTYLYTYVGDALNEYAPDLTYYPTFDDISDMGYITAADVPEVDLDDYVTYGYATANYVSYSYAYNTFVSYSYLGDLEEITEYILGPSSGTSPQNVYATKVELASYATKTELGAYVSKTSLESMSYITMDDVSACGYITIADVPDNGAFRRLYDLSGLNKLGVASDNVIGLDERITYGTVLDSKASNSWNEVSAMGLNGFFTNYEYHSNTYIYSAGKYSLVGGWNSYTFSERGGSFFGSDCLGALAFGIGNKVSYASIASKFGIGAAALGVRNESTNWGELTAGRFSYNNVGETIFAIGCGSGETYRKISQARESEIFNDSKTEDEQYPIVEAFSYIRENAIEIKDNGYIFIKGIGNYEIEENDTRTGDINVVDQRGRNINVVENEPIITYEYPQNIKSLQEVIGELENSTVNALPITGGEVTGPLYVSYQQTNNALYGFKSYSHIVAGDENKTTPAFLASKRYCANGIGSYINMASFFVNGDGRAKFAHKSSAGGGGDDAFMCFNAYGFKIAYSGAAGVSASTEYDLIHSGNIGDMNIIPNVTNTYTLGTDTIRWSNTYSYNYYTGFNTALTSNSDYNLQFSINGAVRFGMDTANFFPNGNGNKNLGTSANKWAYTYTNNLILNGTDIKDTINGMFSYDSTTGILTITPLT